MVKIHQLNDLFKQKQIRNIVYIIEYYFFGHLILLSKMNILNNLIIK